MTLYPGETIKVPFTLVNLGSEGSFLFQVTKTSSLISYVIPFSLALNTNASTTGHMVIASRGNTSEEKDNKREGCCTVRYCDVKVFVSPWGQQITSTPGTSTAALEYIQLQANVPTQKFSLKTGEILKLNSTVMNLAAAETFTFNVSI